MLLDAESTDVETIGRLAVWLLDSGLVYACVWGPGCELVHDIIDEEIVGGGPIVPRYAIEIMTTWHDDTPLDDALRFWLSLAKPSDVFIESCRSSLVLVFGNPEWSARARQAVSDPSRFCREALQTDSNAG